MEQYHKIQTVFKRDPATKFKTLLNEYSLPEFEYLKDNDWIFTEKVDGTNIRIMIKPTPDSITPVSVTFGGKTDNASIPATLITCLQDTFFPQINRLAEIFPDGACLYGEGYGAKIQKGGGNYRSDQDFVLFDVKINDWWLKRKNIEDIADEFGLDIVPIIGEGNLLDMIYIVKHGFNSNWGNFPAEGLVARPYIELKTRSGHRIITKLKHKDFQ